MLRLLALILFLASAAAAAWVWKFERNSFSAFSNENLGVLSAAYLEQIPRERAGGSEAEISLSLLEEERRRRALELPTGAAVVAGFLLLAWALLRAGGRSHARTTGEEVRLQNQLGTPAQLEMGARHKAAELLGCQVDAPPELVLAAYEAQLQLRDPSRMDGLAPDLRRLVMEQRQELERARDLLLR